MGAGLLRLAVGLVGLSIALPSAGRAQTPPRVDRFGDPLPAGALLRLGTVAFRAAPLGGVGFRPTGELVALTQELKLYVWPADGSPKPLVTSLTDPKTMSGRSALAPNARFAAALVEGKGLVVWDLASRKPTEYLSRKLPFANSLAFSTDGTWLALDETTPEKSEILLCNLVTKEWTGVPFPHQFTRDLRFTPNGKFLTVTSFPSITVIDTATRAVVFEPRLPIMPSSRVVLSPDGKTLAFLPGRIVGRAEPVMRMIAVESGQDILGLKLPTGSASWIDFSPDGKTLLLGDQHGIRAWDPVAGKLVREIVGPSEVPPIYSVDHRRLASHSHSAVLLADVVSGQHVHPELIDSGHTNPLVRVVVSPDGQFIATEGEDEEVRIWAADTGRPVCRVRSVRSVRSRRSSPRVAFLPDAKSFITLASDDQTPVLLETTTGRELRRFAVPADLAKRVRTFDLRLSPDGKTLLATADPAHFRDPPYDLGWTIATGQLSVQAEAAGDALTRRRTVESADGRWRVLDGTISRVGWSGSIAVVPSTEIIGITAPVFSADGRLLALTRTPQVGQDGNLASTTVVVFDLTSLARITELATGQVMCQAFSPDGRWLAVAGPEDIAVWDLRTSKRLRQFRSDTLSREKYAVAFTPSGQRLITGHDDGTALVWDVALPRVVSPLTAADCAAAWADLGDPDAGKGFAAVCRLADDPTQALPFLKEKLRPLVPLPVDEIRKLMTDLDSPKFQVRTMAEKKLRGYGDRIELILREGLQANPSTETKKRIEAILADFVRFVPPDRATLQGIRAVWALERLGTPEARRQLVELVTGVASGRLTREAQATLERWPP